MKKHLKRLKPYPLPPYRRDKFIRLDLNENPFGPAPEVMETIKKLTPEDLNTYPYYPEIEKKIAEYINVNPEWIVITNGADDAIKCVFEAHIDHGSRVLMPYPTYSMYEVYTDLYDGRKEFVKYEKIGEFPFEKFLDRIGHADLIVVVNPANPTGEKISREQVIKILEKAAGKPVILDETYWQFGGETLADLVEIYENLFVIHSFSKLFALAGVRLGYLVTKKRELIEKVIEPFRVSSIAVKIGLSALKNLEFYQESLKRIRENQEFLVSEFNKRGLPAYGTHTNFVLVDAGKRADFIKSKLFERGILIKSYRSPDLLKGFLRISVGRKEDLQQLIREIDAILPRKLIIFDMDGVLVDVRDSYRTAIKKTAEFFTGNEVTYEEIQSFKNRGGLNNDWDLTLEIIKSRGVEIKRDQVIEKFQELFLGNNFDGLINGEKWVLDPEILSILFENYRLAIFTSRPGEEALYTLNKNGLADYFDEIIALEDVENPKPAPDGIIKILKKLKIKPENTVYIGDTVDDMIAAKKAGVTGVAIAPPEGDISEYSRLYSKFGARATLSHVNEIISFLNEHFDRRDK